MAQLSNGSRSQPSRAPLAMYSSIFASTSASGSDDDEEGDRSSTTKSGQIGASFSCCSSGIPFHRSLEIQAASGPRFAEFGKVKPVSALKQTPAPSCSVQFARRWLIFELRFS